ncbi:hypothetical protein U9M48_042440 [Paspalum notatum var. saurae]|uniref:Integrase catalytic domain-containing protein n=1 Tax=Paspalum notatum var. saurae TaxID=547442 RepID=A0AAQ3UVB0_PASNO
MEQNMADLVSLIKDMQVQNQEMKKVLADNTSVLKDYVAWKPNIDTKVDALQSGMKDLQGKVDLLVERFEEAADRAPKVLDDEDVDLKKQGTVRSMNNYTEFSKVPENDFKMEKSIHHSSKDGKKVEVNYSKTIFSTVQNKIMAALHSNALDGHFGALVTYIRVKKLFAWPKLKKDVYQFVAQCAIFQQTKVERLSLDFIEGLPTSKHYNCIMVVVDKFSKYAHFIALAHPFTAFQVALLYMDNVFKLHGIPEAIISDRDRIFTSHLWQELFKLTKTELRMSTSYRPQSDGQTERVNQCLEGYLRCFVHSCPSHWKSWLSLAEYWYNTCYHSSLNKTPFEVGDSVYLKLQPYVQNSIATGAYHKLSFRYFGPYKVLARIGSVAYRLDLPASSAVHPVFHNTLVSTDLPDTCIDGFRVPVQILDRRLKNHNNRLVSEVLVKWSSWSVSMATWELEDELKLQFPAAPAWGQAGIKERGIVIGNEQHNEEAQVSGPTEHWRPKRQGRPNVRITGPKWMQTDSSLSNIVSPGDKWARLGGGKGLAKK